MEETGGDEDTLRIWEWDDMGVKLGTWAPYMGWRHGGHGWLKITGPDHAADEAAIPCLPGESLVDATVRCSDTATDRCEALVPWLELEITSQLAESHRSSMSSKLVAALASRLLGETVKR